MTSLLAVIAILVVAIVILLAVAATKPDTFRIQRSTRIAAPAGKIFALVDDLHAHSAWNPFDKDPSLVRNFSGAPAGKGAVYAWQGNRRAGKGRIEITESRPSSAIKMKLDMLSPFEAHNIVDFTFDESGGATNVTWAMRGGQPFMAKVMGTIINCDRMMGGQFEKGLADLKALAER